MSAAPHWLQETLRAFGESLGLNTFALNDSGVAGLAFETGVTLRLEYAYEELVMALSVPTRGEVESLKRLLGYAHPALQGNFTVRTALVQKRSAALLAIRLAASEVTRPALNGAFQTLWRLAEDFRHREGV